MSQLTLLLPFRRHVHSAGPETLFVPHLEWGNTSLLISHVLLDPVGDN